MGYFTYTLKGISWLGTLRVITRIVSFGKTAIIARVLNPSQFGLFGIASLVLSFIETGTETGINVFLIQEKQKIEKFIDTAWIVSIVRGTLITALILILSPFIVIFFNSPSALPLIMLISVVPFIRGFINPAAVRFQKELHFHKEFYYRSGIFLVEASISVLLILIIHNPSALIIGLIGSALFEVGISFIFIRPLPRFAFQKVFVLHILSRGRWTAAAGIFSYIFQNADTATVGKLLGTASLGIYNMAYRISTLPITEIADVVSRVTFPVYVKISSDKKRLYSAYIKTTIIIALFCIPIGILFFLFPKQIILLILGHKWIDGASALQVLTLYGVIHAIGSPSGALFMAVKKQEYVTAITFVSVLVLFVTIFPLINLYGLVGAGLSVVIASVSTIPFLLFFIYKVFKT